MGTVIEVGANHGEDTERLSNHGTNTVYAFEPTPELMLTLQARFLNDDRVFPVPMAVDLEPGWSWFNVCGPDHGGVSSLYAFDDEALKHWEARTGTTLAHDKRYRVMTTRLDTFIVNNNIAAIDYLWIDAQGNDFRVLQSLGEQIDVVKEGRCGAAYSHHLYAGSDNGYIAIGHWLQAHGFQVAVVPDAAQMEADIHFRRP